MNSFRKWLHKPKRDDPSAFARFYYADEELALVASELDSFDGRRDPERCSALVAQLRACQDKLLRVLQGEILPMAVSPLLLSPRDFRAKFPDDIVQDNLPGQLWFGAECLAAGSSILHRELESNFMRPLARNLTRCLDEVRSLLREQCLAPPQLDLTMSPTLVKTADRVVDSRLKSPLAIATTLPTVVRPRFGQKLVEQLVLFDKLFAEFELCYVSAMVPVKSIREYDIQVEVIVLFSETLQRALRLGLVHQEAIDLYEPSLMFTIPRLAIVTGLIVLSDGPLNVDKSTAEISAMFRPFQDLLHKIRELLRALSQAEFEILEKALTSADGETEISAGLKQIQNSERNKTLSFSGLEDTVNRFGDDEDGGNQNLEEAAAGENSGAGTKWAAARESGAAVTPTSSESQAASPAGGIHEAGEPDLATYLRPETRAAADEPEEVRFSDAGGDVDDEADDEAGDDDDEAGDDELRSISFRGQKRPPDVKPDGDDRGDHNDETISSSDETDDGVDSEESDDSDSELQDKAQDLADRSTRMKKCLSPDCESPYPRPSGHTPLSSHFPKTPSIPPTPSSLPSPSPVADSESPRGESPRGASQRGAEAASTAAPATPSRPARHASTSSDDSSSSSSHGRIIPGEISDSSCSDELSVSLVAARLAAQRINPRLKFKDEADMLHRLFVCISGVADQLQSNFASDLRSILKTVFLINASPDDDDDNDDEEAAEGHSNRSSECSVEEALEALEGIVEERDRNSGEEGANPVLLTLPVEESPSRDTAPQPALPPPWIPDEDSPQCQLCQQRFTLIRRRHHCRNCGKVFCGSCSSRFLPLPHFGLLHAVRVCDACHAQHANCLTPAEIQAGWA